MGGADIVGGVEAEEGRALIVGKSGVERGFEGGAPSSFFAFHEANGGDDVHACFTGSFDGGDGGCAGGADVIDDEDRRVFLAEAFDAAAGSVGLFGFADEEAVDQRGTGLVLRAPGAGDRNGGDDGVGAHGESADGCGVQVMFGQKVEDGEASEAGAFGVERGSAAVDVVVGLGAGTEGEIAQAERGAGEEVEEGGAGVSGGHSGLV